MNMLPSENLIDFEKVVAVQPVHEGPNSYYVLNLLWGGRHSESGESEEHTKELRSLFIRDLIEFLPSGHLHCLGDGTFINFKYLTLVGRIYAFGKPDFFVQVAHLTFRQEYETIKEAESARKALISQWSRW